VVADHRDPDAAAQIQQSVAVDIEQPGTVGVVDVDRQAAGYTAGHDRGLALVQGAAARAGDLGHQHRLGIGRGRGRCRHAGAFVWILSGSGKSAGRRVARCE